MCSGGGMGMTKVTPQWRQRQLELRIAKRRDELAAREGTFANLGSAGQVENDKLKNELAEWMAELEGMKDQ
jgi:hypothetical protein